MAKNMETASIIILQGENLKVNGFKIKKMDTELFNMLIMTDIKAIGSMENVLEKEHTSIQTEMLIKVNG